MDVLQPSQEPLVDFGHIVQTLNRIAAVEGNLDGGHALVGRVVQFKIKVGNADGVAHKAVHSLPHHTQALLNGLLKGAAD